MANTNPLAMFEILAEDQPAVTSFYASVFGWSFDYDGAGYGYVHFPVAPRHLLGGIGAAQQGVPGWEKGTAFYLEVPDLQTTLDLVVQHGGAVVVEPTSVDAYRFAMFTDIEQNLIGIIEPFRD
jgi:predicted enzyme related to lactoylglutathione lyase